MILSASPAHKACAAQILPSSIVIATDTEFQHGETLTLQAAARLDADTVAVQIYRAGSVPDLPADLDLNKYLPITQAGYGRFFQKLLVRPTKLLTPNLSPMRMVADLFGLDHLEILSRAQGQFLLAFHNLKEVPNPPPRPPNLIYNDRLQRWDAPTIKPTVVMHFSRADFARIHGRSFLAGLKEPFYKDRARILMRQRKAMQWIEEKPGWTRPDPALEYISCADGLHEVRVQVHDTALCYGKGSLENHSWTFLQLGKCDVLTTQDKEDMRQTFRRRTADAYGYALVDPLNTLLVYEQMVMRDADIYRAFKFAESKIPSLRPTLGGRVSKFLLATTIRDVVAGSRELSSDRGVKDLLSKGGVGFVERRKLSKFGPQTAQAHGGILYNRSSTRFWHASQTMMRDVDMRGCYNNITPRLNVYWGRPIIYEPGSTLWTLKQAISLVTANADRDGWMIRVTGHIRSHPNALIPSTHDAITSTNFRDKLRTGKRRRAAQRAFHLEALRDPASVKGTRGSRLYAAQVESGIVTWATWLMIQALPATLREEYESLTADSIIFYPRSLAASNGREYDRLVQKYREEDLPWQTSLDMEDMEMVERQKIDADYVTLKYSIGAYAQKIGHFRKEAQLREGKGNGLDTAWKLHANTMFGVLASQYMPTNNFVAANLITAQGRAEAFALSQSLNAIQTITDGCTYRLDQIPAVSYEECLQIKSDYPIQRAEHGDGIPFIDPATIPSDNKAFTEWYRARVKTFFAISSPEYDDLFDTHELEHKTTGKSKQVTYDALAVDGAGNYLKATLDDEGHYHVEEFAARGYGRGCKKAILAWLLKTYPEDQLAVLAPVAEDTELLAFGKAGQKARAALDAGVPEVVFPLGMEMRKVVNYRILKASAFIFNTPEQRAALLKKWLKFEDRTSAGLEILALRRSYGGRRQGSLTDLAEELYQLIRNGETNLTKAFNLSKLSAQLNSIITDRALEIQRCKDQANALLVQRIDTRNLDPACLATAYLVTAEDIVHIKAEEAIISQPGVKTNKDKPMHWALLV